MSEHQEKHEAEKEFWDEDILRSRMDFDDEDLIIGPNEYYDKLRPHTPYLGIDRIYRKCIDLLGNVEGKKILDCGCGNGLMTTLLAQRGALVTATDISPKSLEMTRLRAKLNKVGDRVETLLMNAEELDFEQESFDFVVGSFVLHHTDLEKSGPGIKCVLKTGGKGVFVETSGLNPLLMLARTVITGRMGVPKYGTKTESPLSSREIQTLKRIFEGRVHLHHPIFLCFRMIAGYIKPLSGPGAKSVLLWMDQTVEQLLKYFNKFSYSIIVEIGK